MGVIELSGFPVERLVHEELLEVLMPSVELTDPIQPVVVRSDVADLTDEPTEPDACGASGMLGEPCQALALDVYDAALPWDLRIGISDGPREAVRAIRSKTGYPDAETMSSIVCFPSTHLRNHADRFDRLTSSRRGVKQVLQDLHLYRW